MGDSKPPPEAAPRRPLPPPVLRAQSKWDEEALEAALLAHGVVRRKPYREWFLWFLPTRRGLRRVVHYVVGSVVVIPALNLVLTPLHGQHLEIQVPVAAAFGLVVGVRRPRGISVGILLAATGLATLVLTGHVRSLADSLGVLLALLCYFGFGLALGITENIVRAGE